MMWVAADHAAGSRRWSRSRRTTSRRGWPTRRSASSRTSCSPPRSPTGLPPQAERCTWPPTRPARSRYSSARGPSHAPPRKTRVSELDGLGRAMPWTFGAFLVASMSIIGLPPMGGTWSKWLLLQGTADAGQAVMIGGAAGRVAAVVRLPAADSGPGVPPAPAEGAVHGEAPLACVVPLVLTARGLCRIVRHPRGRGHRARGRALGLHDRRRRWLDEPRNVTADRLRPGRAVRAAAARRSALRQEPRTSRSKAGSGSTRCSASWSASSWC